ncbi:MAG: vWA domain-containing protein [Microthrixaceae bacterium]
MADRSRRTTSRRDLSRHEGFEEVSPELGVLDEDALNEQMEAAPEETLAMLADMVGATDRSLADLARRIAAQLSITLARSGAARSGVGRIARRPLGSGGDIDLDHSMEAFAASRDLSSASPASRAVVHQPEHLTESGWTRHGTALCLLVDRSGSMSGDRLATAAVAAAAALNRAPLDTSVVCFSENAVVVKSQDSTRPVDDVVGDVMALRGFGVTDIGLALRTATSQLARSSAARRIAVLLSDCRTTTGGDPTLHTSGLDELVILAPADDTADARDLAEALDARWAPVSGPLDVPEAFRKVLGN